MGQICNRCAREVLAGKTAGKTCSWLGQVVEWKADWLVGRRERRWHGRETMPQQSGTMPQQAWRSDPGNPHSAGYFRNSVLKVGGED